MWPTRSLACAYPPVALLLLTSLQVAAYVAVGGGDRAAMGMHLGADGTRPEEWFQVVTSLFAHADLGHFASNMLTQVALGVVIEAVHGPMRFVAVYFASGVGGALVYRAHWCIAYAPAPYVYVGASPAVYGLMSAYAAHLLINWAELRLRWAWLAALVLVFATDATVSIVDPQPRVAYAAHLGGAAYGVCIGVLVLRNARVLRCERGMYVAAAGAAIAITLAALLLCA